MKFRNLLLTATFLAAIPANAQAQSAGGDVAALRAEIAALKAQMAAISAKVDDTAKTAADAAKASAKAPEVKWKGAPQIKGEGGWSFKPRGRLLYDVASVNAPNSIIDPGLGFSNEVRRARLGVQGDIPGGFGYKFEIDFSGSDVEFTDAFLSYKDDGLKVTVGQHNNFQSLEELSSSNDTSFMERAAFTDAFGYKRRVGVSAEYASGPVLAQAGVFTDSVDDLGNDQNNSIGADGRLVFMPKLGDTQLHVGGSYHWRDLGDAINSVRYRQRPLVHSTDTRFINTGNITSATSETSYGLEAAAIHGRFHVAGEAQWQKVKRTGFANPTFDGQSIEAGVFLTNDTRQYKKGVFKGVKVKNPLNKGGLGALQFNVRYDRLDLNDAGIVGGKQNGYMASLIWTPIDYVRFMLNYAKLDYTDAAILAGASRNYSVDSVGARAQISF